MKRNDSDKFTYVSIALKDALKELEKCQQEKNEILSLIDMLEKRGELEKYRDALICKMSNNLMLFAQAKNRITMLKNLI